MEKAPLLAGALLALVPVAALLPGCGGGNGGLVTPTGTAGPTPTYTSGPVPTDTTTGTPGPTGTITPTSTSVPGATATPTITPQPTSTTAVPTSTAIPAGAFRTNLTFTPSSDSNFKNIPVSDGYFDLRTADNSNTLQFLARSASVDLEYLNLVGQLSGAGQGNGYSANSANASTIEIQNNVRDNNEVRTRVFRFQAGTITITKFSKSNTALSFNNVVFGAVAGPGGAKGTVTINGTISGPYSTNQPR